MLKPQPNTMNARWRFVEDDIQIVIGSVPVLYIRLRRKEGQHTIAAYVYSGQTALSRNLYPSGYGKLTPDEVLKLVTLLKYDPDFMLAVRDRLVELGWTIPDPSGPVDLGSPG